MTDKDDAMLWLAFQQILDLPACEITEGEFGDEISNTGKKVGFIYEVMKRMFTDEELTHFDSYINQTTAMGPMLDPTSFRGTDAFDQLHDASERITVLHNALELVKK